MFGIGIGIGVGLKSKKLSAAGFDPDALVFFAAATAAGAPVTGAYLDYYNNSIKALKAANQWDELDSLYIDATGNKTWGLIDVRKPARTATILNTYAGDWTVGLGFKGNGSNFGVLTNYNPTVGTNKFTRNSASFGVLLIDNNANSPAWDIGASNLAITGGCFIRTYAPTPNGGSINNVYVGSNTYKKPVLNSYCWIGMTRTGATTYNNYLNGVNIESGTQASDPVENTQFGRFGAYTNTFLGGFYSLNRQACFYAGSGNLSQKEIMNALNINFFTPQGTKAALTNRIIFEGDSRTGDASSPSFSNTFAMPRRVITNLGNNWCGVAVSAVNETVQQMVTQYAAEVAPYVNTSLLKNIFVVWGGTNDITAFRTAAQIKADLETLCNSAKAQGYKVVIVGEIDRNWTSYAAFNAVRASLRSSMLADFTSNPAAQIYLPASGITYADAYIDLYGLANFQNYASAWMQADGVHPNTLGSQNAGDRISAGINLI